MKFKKLAIGVFALSSLGALAAANDTSAISPRASNPGYTTAQPSSQGDTSQVSQLQQALNEKGYNVGTVDGQMGPKTKTALRQFQQAQGLSASGQLDSQTMAALTMPAGGKSQPGTSQPSSSEPTSSSPSTMSQPTPSQGSAPADGKSGFSPQ